MTAPDVLRWQASRIDELESDVQRVTDERNRYAATVDELIADNQRLADSKWKRIAEQSMAHLDAVLRDSDEGTGAAQRLRRLAAKAHLAEHGHVPPDIEEMRQAYAEWEGRR